MNFKEISAWIEAVAVLVLYGIYAANAPTATSTIAALRLYVEVAIVFVVLVVALNIIAAVIHRPEKEDERDKLIAAKASRNAWWVLMNGMFLAILALLAPLPASALPLPQATMAAHLLVLAMAAGELIRFASQIYYYRRGA